MADTRRGRPARSALDNFSPAASVPDRADIAALLALSDERDVWLLRLLAAERAAYDRGHRDGHRDGYELAAAHMAAAWDSIADPISRGILPGGDPGTRRARAERLDRADAWERWKDFTRRAFADAPRKRTGPQAGIVALYKKRPG
jgi:hypothetical protein